MEEQERCQEDAKNGFYTMLKSDKKRHLPFLAQLINAGVGSVGFMLIMTGYSKINLINTVLIFIVNIIFGGMNLGFCSMYMY